MKKLIFFVLILFGLSISAYAQMGSDMTGGQKGEMSQHSMMGEGQSMMDCPKMQRQGMMGGCCQMMGQGMMGGMRGMARERMGRHNPWFRHGVSMILYHADELGLSDKQKKQLDDIKMRYSKDIIRQHADSKIAEIDLEALLREPEANLSQVKEALKKVENAKTQIRYLRIEALFESRKVLTNEQKNDLKKLMEMRGTPRMRGMMGATEPEEEQEETPEEELPTTDIHGH